jgi:CheY-like chemotaxis protein
VDFASTIRSFAALADASTRRAALDDLARQLDAVAVVLLAPALDDPSHMIADASSEASPTAIDDLVARAAQPGIHQGEQAVAYAYPDVAVVVVGHQQGNAELESALAMVAPLLAALLHAEQEARASRRQHLLRAARELRDPLAPIATAIQMLRIEGTRTRTHEILDRQVARLMRIVDELVSDTIETQPLARRGASVLVVDDNEDAADLLGSLLESLGYAVLVTHTADDALAVLDRFTPDIALCDIGLPGMDGYELARELHARLPGLPLVAITGYGQDKDRERALEAGFTTHLVKPVAITCLEELLENLLATRAVTVRGDGNEPLPRASS